MLRQQYPQHLMQQLQEAAQGAFDDAAAAFPNQPRPHSRSLRQLVACTSLLCACCACRACCASHNLTPRLPA